MKDEEIGIREFLDRFAVDAQKQREEIKRLNLDHLIAEGVLAKHAGGWYEILKTKEDVPEGFWHLGQEGKLSGDGRLMIRLANREALLEALDQF